jgi:quinol monooxygenase YgiN
MVKVALLVRLRAKPGKESALEQLLTGGLPIVQEERDTPQWFALKFDASTFGIFDAFPTDAARQAHLTGRLASALMAKAPELLAEQPSIERVDVLAAKT